MIEFQFSFENLVDFGGLEYFVENKVVVKIKGYFVDQIIVLSKEQEYFIVNKIVNEEFCQVLVFIQFLFFDEKFGNLEYGLLLK